MIPAVAPRAILLAAAVGVTGTGCGTEGSGPKTPARPEPAASYAAEPSEAGASDDPAEAAAQRAVALALASVAELRQLPVKRPVRGVVLSRQEMADRVHDHIQSEVPEDVVAGQTELLVAFGVVPVDFDYVGSVVSLMSTELAGFYEPRDGTMYLASDLEGADRDATLSHELVHALQDQHYDLSDHVRYRPDANDAQSAVHTLAEGDATSAMMDDLLRDQGMSATDLPDAAIGVQVRASMELDVDVAHIPSIIKRSVVAPYVDGMALVHWLRRRGGWAAVDEIWRRPPESTEQVLHPEKLLSREAPEAVPVPGAPPAGPHALLYRDVMGEQSLRLMLEEWLPRRSAVAAASDWGGDRIAVYRDDSRIAVAWHIRYDTVAAAERGFAGLARAVERAEEGEGTLSAGGQALRGREKPGQSCVERPQLGPFAVLRHRREVVAVTGPYRRQGQRTHAAGDCPAALEWARDVAAGSGVAAD